MFVCVFKQKTAYEMRISDWSSDVCSSVLVQAEIAILVHGDLALTEVDAVLGEQSLHAGQAFTIDNRSQPLVARAIGDPGRAAFGHVDLVTGCPRSEEHTSELQSLMRTSYAVFCLKTKHNSTRQNSHN